MFFFFVKIKSSSHKSLVFCANCPSSVLGGGGWGYSNQMSPPELAEKLQTEPVIAGTSVLFTSQPVMAQKLKSSLIISVHMASRQTKGRVKSYFNTLQEVLTSYSLGILHGL